MKRCSEKLQQQAGRGVASIVVAALLISVALASQATAADAPRVAKVTPAHGQMDVNPNLRELRIEFDQPMNMGSGFSIVGGGDTFPEVLGTPRWISDRVIVTPIRLKPDHHYWLSVNSSRFQNFKGKDGKAAVPYPIEFRTASSGMPIEVKPPADLSMRPSFMRRTGIATRHCLEVFLTRSNGRSIPARNTRPFAGRSRS